MHELPDATNQSPAELGLSALIQNRPDDGSHIEGSGHLQFARQQRGVACSDTLLQLRRLEVFSLLRQRSQAPALDPLQCDLGIAINPDTEVRDQCSRVHVGDPVDSEPADESLIDE